MARKLRFDCPGTIRHLMSRGDPREAIFHDDKDQELFLATLAEAPRFAWFQIADSGAQISTEGTYRARFNRPPESAWQTGQAGGVGVGRDGDSQRQRGGTPAIRAGDGGAAGAGRAGGARTDSAGLVLWRGGVSEGVAGAGGGVGAGRVAKAGLDGDGTGHAPEERPGEAESGHEVARGDDDDVAVDCGPAANRDGSELVAPAVGAAASGESSVNMWD